MFFILPMFLLFEFFCFVPFVARCVCCFVVVVVVVVSVLLLLLFFKSPGFASDFLVLACFDFLLVITLKGLYRGFV